MGRDFRYYGQRPARDPALILKVDDLINIAMGTKDKNVIDFKMLQFILYLLAGHVSILEQMVELRLPKSGDMLTMKDDYYDDVKRGGSAQKSFEKEKYARASGDKQGDDELRAGQDKDKYKVDMDGKYSGGTKYYEYEDGGAGGMLDQGGKARDRADKDGISVIESPTHQQRRDKKDGDKGEGYDTGGRVRKSQDGKGRGGDRGKRDRDSESEDRERGKKDGDSDEEYGSGIRQGHDYESNERERSRKGGEEEYARVETRKKARDQENRSSDRKIRDIDSDFEDSGSGRKVAERYNENEKGMRGEKGLNYEAKGRSRIDGDKDEDYEKSGRLRKVQGEDRRGIDKWEKDNEYLSDDSGKAKTGGYKGRHSDNERSTKDKTGSQDTDKTEDRAQKGRSSAGIDSKDYKDMKQEKNKAREDSFDRDENGRGKRRNRRTESVDRGKRRSRRDSFEGDKRDTSESLDSDVSKRGRRRSKDDSFYGSRGTRDLEGSVRGRRRSRDESVDRDGHVRHGSLDRGGKGRDLPTKMNRHAEEENKIREKFSDTRHIDAKKSQNTSAGSDIGNFIVQVTQKRPVSPGRDSRLGDKTGSARGDKSGKYKQLDADSAGAGEKDERYQRGRGDRDRNAGDDRGRTERGGEGVSGRSGAGGGSDGGRDRDDDRERQRRRKSCDTGKRRKVAKSEKDEDDEEGDGYVDVQYSGKSKEALGEGGKCKITGNARDIVNDEEIKKIRERTDSFEAGGLWKCKGRQGADEQRESFEEIEGILLTDSKGNLKFLPHGDEQGKGRGSDGRGGRDGRGGERDRDDTGARDKDYNRDRRGRDYKRDFDRERDSDRGGRGGRDERRKDGDRDARGSKYEGWARDDVRAGRGDNRDGKGIWDRDGVGGGRGDREGQRYGEGRKDVVDSRDEYRDVRGRREADTDGSGQIGGVDDGRDGRDRDSRNYIGSKDDDRDGKDKDGRVKRQGERDGRRGKDGEENGRGGREGDIDNRGRKEDDRAVIGRVGGEDDSKDGRYRDRDARSGTGGVDYSRDGKEGDREGIGKISSLDDGRSGREGDRTGKVGIGGEDDSKGDKKGKRDGKGVADDDRSGKEGDTASRVRISDNRGERDEDRDSRGGDRDSGGGRVRGRIDGSEPGGKADDYDRKGDGKSQVSGHDERRGLRGNLNMDGKLVDYSQGADKDGRKQDKRGREDKDDELGSIRRDDTIDSDRDHRGDLEGDRSGRLTDGSKKGGRGGEGTDSYKDGKNWDRGRESGRGGKGGDSDDRGGRSGTVGDDNDDYGRKGVVDDRRGDNGRGRGYDYDGSGKRLGNDDASDAIDRDDEIDGIGGRRSDKDRDKDHDVSGERPVRREADDRDKKGVKSDYDRDGGESSEEGTGIKYVDEVFPGQRRQRGVSISSRDEGRLRKVSKDEERLRGTGHGIDKGRKEDDKHKVGKEGQGGEDESISWKKGKDIEGRDKYGDSADGDSDTKDSSGRGRKGWDSEGERGGREGKGKGKDGDIDDGSGKGGERRGGKGGGKREGFTSDDEDLRESESVRGGKRGTRKDEGAGKGMGEKGAKGGKGRDEVDESDKDRSEGGKGRGGDDDGVGKGLIKTDKDDNRGGREGKGRDKGREWGDSDNEDSDRRKGSWGKGKGKDIEGHEGQDGGRRGMWKEEDRDYDDEGRGKEGRDAEKDESGGAKKQKGYRDVAGEERGRRGRDKDTESIASKEIKDNYGADTGGRDKGLASKQGRGRSGKGGQGYDEEDDAGGRGGSGALAGKQGAGRGAASAKDAAGQKGLKGRDASLTSVATAASVGRGGKGGAGRPGAVRREGSVARVGSIEVVTQSQFQQLENAVRDLQKKAGPMAAPIMPENTKLLVDISRGDASLTDVIQALQLQARLQAAERAIDRMSELIAQLAAAGALTPEMLAKIADIRSEVDAGYKEVPLGPGGKAEQVSQLARRLTAGSIRAAGTASDGGPGAGGRGTGGRAGSIASRGTRGKGEKLERFMRFPGAVPSFGGVSAGGVSTGILSTKSAKTIISTDCITVQEMDDALNALREEFERTVLAQTARANSNADAAAQTARGVADKMDVVMDLNERVSMLYNMVDDYTEQLNGFDAGVATQIEGFQQQMNEMHNDLKDGLAQLQNVNNNAETAAVLELTERYEGLVADLDLTLHSHQAMTTHQGQLSDELRSLLECVEMLREQKADRDEVLDGLRDKADISRLEGLLSEQEFDRVRAELELRMRMCYDKFRSQDKVWMGAVKDFSNVIANKAEMMQLVGTRDDMQEQLHQLKRKCIQLAKIMGEPKAAVLTRKLAKDGTCASCKVPALMEPTEIRAMAPPPLPAMRKKWPEHTGADGDVCLQDVGVARLISATNLLPLSDGDVDMKDVHICKRWVGGSHTLLTSQVKREVASPLQLHAPSTRRYIGPGTDGRLYMLAEACIPCEECNTLYTEKIPGEIEVPRDGHGPPVSDITVVTGTEARRVTIISENDLPLKVVSAERIEKRPSTVETEKQPSMGGKQPSIAENQPSMAEKKHSMVEKRVSLVEKRVSLVERKSSLFDKGSEGTDKNLAVLDYKLKGSKESVTAFDEPIPRRLSDIGVKVKGRVTLIDEEAARRAEVRYETSRLEGLQDGQDNQEAEESEKKTKQ